MSPPSRSCAALLAAAALASCTTEALQRPQAMYTNPVLDREFPDPAVLATDDRWFYAFATQGGHGDRMLNIQVARSRDLIQWEHLGDALPEKPRWAAAKQKFWAPHVLYDSAEKRYFMYYSAEPDHANGKCLAVATSAAPAGPFVDSGSPLLCGEGIEHIDPMAFDDPRTGTRLLYWGSGSRPIKAQALAADRVRFVPGSAPRDVLFPDRLRDYSSLIEGAWVIYRSGTYYLFYSGGLCCGPKARYALMVARADDALGPFESFARPILEHSANWRAPGHNSVITDAEGTDWILYHAMRTVPHRLMLLDRIVYRDGWPRIEGDQPSATRQRAPVAGGR